MSFVITRLRSHVDPLRRSGDLPDAVRSGDARSGHAGVGNTAGPTAVSAGAPPADARRGRHCHAATRCATGRALPVSTSMRPHCVPGGSTLTPCRF
jgi:hypothetical protein